MFERITALQARQRRSFLTQLPGCAHAIVQSQALIYDMGRTGNGWTEPERRHECHNETGQSAAKHPVWSTEPGDKARTEQEQSGEEKTTEQSSQQPGKELLGRKASAPGAEGR
jgi:hypothetical protein